MTSDMTRHTVILLFLFFTLGAPVLGAYLKRRHRRKKQQLQTIISLCEKVEAALNDHAPPEKEAIFADSLEQAAVTMKFQQPRLELQSGKPGTVPEKYTFFANLAARGMSTTEISEILSISQAEAGQLATLVCISRRNRCYE